MRVDFQVEILTLRERLGYQLVEVILPLYSCVVVQSQLWGFARESVVLL